MASDDHILLEGIIQDVLGDGKFRVKVSDDDTTVLATLSGKIRKNKIRIIQNDKVQIAVSAYDRTRAIIKFRLSK